MGKKRQTNSARGSKHSSSLARKSMNNSISSSDVDPRGDFAAPEFSVLSTQSRGGISKPKHKKPLSRQQRIRRENGKSRADAVFQQLEKKVSRSQEKGLKVESRRVTWDELNSSIKIGKMDQTLKLKQKLEDETDRSMPKASAVDQDLNERPTEETVTPNSVPKIGDKRLGC